MAQPDDHAPRLLVLGAGPAQIGLLRAAREHGIWTAACDRDPRAPGFAFADRRCVVSIDDEPAIERLVLALSPDGLVAPGRDRSTAVAARIAEKLGITHPLTTATALLGASRGRQHETLREAGVPQPRWQSVAGNAAEVALSLPAVVKFVDREGHSQLRLAGEAGELERALAEARIASRGGPTLIEEYVEGPELTVTGFSARGEYAALLVSDRLCAGPPAFGVPLEETWPSPHAQRAAEVARRAVETIGLVDGPSHVRLRLSRGGPEVLQVSVRLGANHEAELVELVTGVDLNRLALAAALDWPHELGETVAAPAEGIGGATVRSLIVPAGRLASIELPQGQKGVVSTWIYHRAGHDFGPLRRPSDRAGALLVAGATREEAVRRAEAALECIRFVPIDAEALV